MDVIRPRPVEQADTSIGCLDVRLATSFTVYEGASQKFEADRLIFQRCFDHASEMVLTLRCECPSVRPFPAIGDAW